MVEFATGDILQADVEALVNTVNCVGVMGRGIALQFRKAFPENYKVYKAACAKDEVTPGRMLIVPLESLQSPRLIINFPTKQHWKGKSRMEFIHDGLNALVAEVIERNIKSLAIPALGCGLGGLDWQSVCPLIEQAFAPFPEIRVVLYPPDGAPSLSLIAKTTPKPSLTKGRAALLGLMWRYLAAVMEPAVTLLEIHKLMYFMQESGEPLRLQFSKGLYGPYASNLRHVLNALEGHYLSGFADGHDKPDKQIELTKGAAEEAEHFLQGHQETRERFDRVARLIEGFETSYGMELLATVHWVARQDHQASVANIVAGVHQWNTRKKMFSPQRIELALKILQEQGWLHPAQ